MAPLHLDLRPAYRGGTAGRFDIFAGAKQNNTNFWMAHAAIFGILQFAAHIRKPL